MSAIDELVTLMRDRGDSQYGGESVSQLEHALQAASLAQQEGAGETLIAAALLHDIGHLLHDLPDDAPDEGVDDQHEDSGCRFLRRLFPAAVYEPVRLHVSAKRYLCAVDPAYFEHLSGPSRTSLLLQGGPMTASEAAVFECEVFADDAIRLRRWDDEAKDPQRSTPPLENWIELLRRVAKSDAPTQREGTT